MIDVTDYLMLTLYVVIAVVLIIILNVFFDKMKILHEHRTLKIILSTLIVISAMIIAPTIHFEDSMKILRTLLISTFAAGLLAAMIFYFEQKQDNIIRRVIGSLFVVFIVITVVFFLFGLPILVNPNYPFYEIEEGPVASVLITTISNPKIFITFIVSLGAYVITVLATRK